MDEPLKEVVIQNVTVQSPSNKRFTILITIETTENTENAHALIDCGAEGLFVDASYAKRWRKELLKHQIRVRNVNGTINANGNIKEKCLITFRIGDEEMTEWFHVTNTGDQNLILGLPWLTKRNPIIDWRGKSLEIHTSTGDSNCSCSLWRQIHSQRYPLPNIEEHFVSPYALSLLQGLIFNLFRSAATALP